MEFRRFDIDGVVEITPQRFADSRGYFSEIYREDIFNEHVGPVRFVQENQSLSMKLGTLRGIHFQIAPSMQGKLVRCVSGSIYDVAVDLRENSPSFGQWLAVILNGDVGNQLWIPEGFGHGFCTLKSETIVCYRVTDYYSREHDKGVAWDDPGIGIDWPDVADPESLSPKDRCQPALTELPPYFAMAAT